jgi:transposase
MYVNGTSLPATATDHKLRPLIPTATVAAIGNGAAFRRGRDFVGWVVPRQYSTGGKQELYRIIKRGNVYLHRLLIHGARSALFRVKYDTGGADSGCIGWHSMLHATRS